MVKAVLVYISREGCTYCTMFEREWASVKGSNPNIIYRQYKVPQSKVPEPLAAYEKWYPLLVLVPAVNYLQHMSISPDGVDIVTNSKTITEAVVFNGIVTPRGGSVSVEYSNPGKVNATTDNVNAWVSKNIEGFQDISLGGALPPPSTAPAPSVYTQSTLPQAPVPPFTGGRLSTIGSSGRYRSAWE